MTVPVRCPPPVVDVSSAAPLKRRRRAPASGASDDCFACIKRRTKCDRRRPYCSQCLEVDNECSGYKTQLTWGVGVASRGKLRGLSLPVAKSAPATRSPITKHQRAAAPFPKHADPRDLAASLDDGHIKIKLEGSGSLSASRYTAYDFVNVVPGSPSSVHSQPIGTDWPMPMPQEFVRSPPTSAPVVRPSLQPLLPPFVGPADDLNVSSSPSGSMSAYGDADYSPLDRVFTADDVPFLAGSMSAYHSYSSSPVDHGLAYGLMQEGHGPTSYPDQYYSPSEVSSSLSSHPAAFEMGDNQQLDVASPHGSEVNYDDEISRALSASRGAELFMDSPHASSEVTWNLGVEGGYTTSGTDRNVPPLLPPESFHIPIAPDIPPSLEYFLNYYDKFICPVMVAVDTPSNPYRLQILSLALESRSLQHAICTLASGHMRMRQRQNPSRPHRPSRPLEPEEQVRIPGGYQLVSNVRNAPVMDFASDGVLDEPATQEECFHRSRAAALLNQQLGDPSTARHDAALATLLILCSYRLCVSGIAQFKTQLTGAKKLLRLRSSGRETGNWGWMETLFTFFDAAAATVSDREAQLRGDYLDMISAPAPPGCAFQNLAGCDAGLFKTIARLGRLNLLSQRRPVLDPFRRSSDGPHDPGRSDQPQPRLAGQALADFYKFHAQKFDVNGFLSPLDHYDVEGAAHSTPSTSSPISNIPSSTYSPLAGASSPADEARLLFWWEWAGARHELQAWDFSAATLTSALPVPPTPQQARDFSRVSEAFRYAALLYLERLASPQLPSSHSNIQHFVTRTFYFINELQGSDLEKFLLWPLFVLGSESISELHRGVVRARCRVLSQRSGYSNGLVGLEILERCWREMDAEAAGVDQARGLESRGQSPFRWTRWMEGLDGEIMMA